ncbi:MAG: cobalt ECF transporter T component CbiQ [Candidatus Xenobiia bacterium LiM19]
MKTPKIPEWYGAPLSPPPGKAKAAGIRKSSYRKMLADIAGILGRALPDPSGRSSWCFRMDARAKAVSYIALIIGIISAHTIWQLLLLLACALLVIITSRIIWKGLLILWLGVPFFSLVIILPAALNIVTPGHGVLTLLQAGSHLGPWTVHRDIAITSGGLLIAARFILRTLCCVTFSYILLATTKPEVLLNAFRRLGLPRIFGMILAMTYRYLMTLLRAAEDLHLAVISRTISTGTVKGRQRWAAAGIGSLLRKSFHLSREAHLAMISRGFNGDPRVSPPPPMKSSDYLTVAGTLILVISTFLMRGEGGM